MLSAYRAENSYRELCDWYDGYRFGATEIFNPWSVISYISRKCVPQAYWANTGRNEILDEVLNAAAPDVMEKLEALLQGETAVARIDMNVIYPSLNEDPSNIYSILLAAGYLKAVKGPSQSSGFCMCQIAIPNKEIGVVYRNEILNHLIRCGAVKRSSAEKVAESFFHGLTAGMLALMDDQYKITSNREFGDGRYDICLYPKTGQLPGILIEVKCDKAVSEEHLEKRAKEALEQINEKRYDTEMKKDGVTQIVKYGIAFSGKRMRIVCES